MLRSTLTFQKAVQEAKQKAGEAKKARDAQEEKEKALRKQELAAAGYVLFDDNGSVNAEMTGSMEPQTRVLNQNTLKLFQSFFRNSEADPKESVVEDQKTDDKEIHPYHKWEVFRGRVELFNGKKMLLDDIGSSCNLPEGDIEAIAQSREDWKGEKRARAEKELARICLELNSLGLFPTMDGHLELPVSNREFDMESAFAYEEPVGEYKPPVL